MKYKLLLLAFSLTLFGPLAGQEQGELPLKVFNYSQPQTYEIGGVTISGLKYLMQTNVLIQMTGLAVGDQIEIPGSKIRDAIDKLWAQKLFSDIRITATRFIDNKVFIDIYLQEQPRLSSFSFSGVSKTEADDLREKVKLIRGTEVTANMLSRTNKIIKEHFINKGYLNTGVEIHQSSDSTLANYTVLNIIVEKNDRVKIRDMVFEGVTVFPESKLRRAMKETKQKAWYNIFKSSKYIQDNFDEDLNKIIAKYNELGYRDAQIVKDSLYHNEDGTVGLVIGVEEGKQYFFRDISWVGNTKYSSDFLSEQLKIEKGDIFDQSLLDARLSYDPDAIANYYLD